MYRDMDLFESIRYFTMGADQASRMAAARSYMELASTFDGLDTFFLDVESQFLDDLGLGASGGQRARLAFCYLRRGKFSKAKEILAAEPPKDAKFYWALGRLALQFASADKAPDKAELKKLQDAATKDQKVFLRVVSYTLGRDLQIKDTGYYGQALQSLASGDLFGGMVSLQMVDRPSSDNEPGPDLYLYHFMKQIFARMAIEALKGVDGTDAALLMGRAKLLIGDAEGAEKTLSKARNVRATPQAVADSARLYGPEIDALEAVNLAAVYDGLALQKLKKPAEAEKVWQTAINTGLGPYEKARLAAEELKAGLKTGPLGDPAGIAAASLAEVEELEKLSSRLTGADVIHRLLDARYARAAMDSAAIARAQGRMKDALENLDKAHMKRQGYKPTYVNPPSFLVELSRAYAETGEFAPSVEILFELSNQMSTCRVAYESLKRLYASTTGGEAPPR